MKETIEFFFVCFLKIFNQSNKGHWLLSHFYHLHQWKKEETEKKIIRKRSLVNQNSFPLFLYINQLNSSVASSYSLPENFIKNLSDKVLSCTIGIQNVVKQPKIHQNGSKGCIKKMEMEASHRILFRFGQLIY